VIAAASRIPGLPMPLTPLIGREREVGAVVSVLRDEHARLVTLTGPGGTGKTRLAIQVASTLSAGAADGARFVSLAPLRDPELVIAAIAQALGVREAAGQPLLASLVAALGDRSLLLVLDNFEQVVSAAPPISDLLGSCAGLSLLVTSRVPLHLYGERVVAVPPLAVPDASNLPPVDELARVEAVRLFTTRAQAAQSSFTLNENNAATVADICVRLDGLPLAIELAAARVSIFAPRALAERLDRRLPLLVGGPRDAPARQQTLRGAIAWSYDLLAPDEQQLLRQLSVFAGGWTLEAAEAVCQPGGDVVSGLSALVDHSLVRQAEQPDGSARFGMLATIREYGLEQLEQQGEAEPARERHARYYLTLAEQVELGFASAQQDAWLRTCQEELDNVRAALAWAIEHDVEAALLGAGGLWQYWLIHAHLAEGRRWLAQALANGAAAPAHARAKALDAAAGLASWQADLDQAHHLFEDALRLYRALDDRRNIANTLRGCARLASVVGDFTRAETLAMESVTLFQQLGDNDGLSIALFVLGNNLFCQGDYVRAEAILSESRVLALEGGESSLIANITTVMGFVALFAGNVAEASQRLAESLAACARMADTRFIAVCFEGLGHVALIRGQPERAAHLFGAAAALRLQIGFPLGNVYLARVEQDTALVRATLGEERYAAVTAAGLAMPLDDAVAFALADDPESPASGDDEPAPHTLSPRELEVLRLLAEGRTDREIGVELFISHHTVARHVSSILGKLGVESRTAAATWAVRHALI
jgi:predicted ATPase/DNA-binding CsgD family transcriptional regulator